MYPSMLLVLLVAVPVFTKNIAFPRISGGMVAEPHAFPYTAFLVVNGWPDVTWYCHGALISEDTILTTADCILWPPVAYVDVKLGAQNITHLEDTQVVFRSTETYISETQRVGIIRLPEPVVPNESIRPIQLPPLSDIGDQFEGETGTVSGWGLTDPANGDVLSDVLKSFEGQIISSLDCSRNFTLIPTSYLCTSPSGLGSGCGGDDGAPLVVNGTTLVGLLGIYSEACDVNLPSAFVRVTADLEWIYQFL